MNELDSIIDGEVPTIQLHYLVSRYLPLLINGTAEEWNTTWLRDVAINIHAKVHVIGKDGSIRYVIPPMVVPSTIHDNRILQNVTDAAQAAAAVHPMRGAAILREQLPKVIELNPNVQTTEGMSVWRTILMENGFGDKLPDYVPESGASGGFSYEEDDTW